MSFLTTLPRARYSPKGFDGFKPAQATFSMGTAHAMAWACQLGYETADPAKVVSIAKDWSIKVEPDWIISRESATILPMSSTQLVVGVHDGVAIIMFPGTDPLTLPDLVTDLAFRPNTKGIARGFADAAESVQNPIRVLLDGPLAGLPVFVTGHSLGAALAVITAQRIRAGHQERVRAVYTFGMPRPGNAAFQSVYDEALGSVTYRLVHGDDAVSTVPPAGFDARHVGRYLRCKKLGKFNAAALTSSFGSNDPDFVEGVLAQIRTQYLGPLSGVLSMAERSKLAAALLLGIGSGGMRTDPGGIAIELLPPPLRDHMPDRYIEATRE